MAFVTLTTNIDAYRSIYDYKFMRMEVDQRPLVGDLIEHNGDKRLPFLAIVSISVEYRQCRGACNYEIYYTCYLHFAKNTNPDLTKDILNHKYGG